MKKQLVPAFTIFITLALSGLAIGASHGEQGGMSGMEHGKMEGMEHGGGMAMHGDMMMLGKQSVDGVEAMIHLKDTGEAMAKMGMDMTHHIMIFFTDEESGNHITDGLAAVKITDPSGQTSAPAKLMGMGEGFGADVMLKDKGEYRFEIGTKLKDGKKRQFEARYTVK